MDREWISRLFETIGEIVPSDGSLGEKVFSAICEQIEMNTLAELLLDHSSLVEDGIRLRPELLTIPSIWRVDNMSLRSSIERAPNKLRARTVAAAITAATPAAVAALENAGAAATPDILDRLQSDDIQISLDPWSSIVRVLCNNHVVAVLDYLESRDFMKVELAAALANWLGESEIVIARGPKPWSSALRHTVVDDLRDYSTFQSFLFSRALDGGSEGAERLLILVFDLLHSEMASSRLSESIFAFWTRLPFLGSYNWDNCQRLRQATVNAFIKQKLDPESFFSLSNDGYTFGRLINTVLLTEGGREFFLELIVAANSGMGSEDQRRRILQEAYYFRH